MARINQKALIKKTIGFCHLGFLFKLLAGSRLRRGRPFFWFEGRSYTYGETYKEARRFADLFGHYRALRLDQGRLKPEDTLAVAVYMDNCPEFVFALFGAALSGTAIIAVNTGFRGDTLANVLNIAETGLIITSQANLSEIERMLPALNGISSNDVLIVDKDPGQPASTGRALDAVLADPAVTAGARFPDKIDVFTPLIVIYTSGTTGAPKGVPCNHTKLIGAGIVTWSRLKLGKDDKGYVCMPMFHSNAWYLGIMPTLLGGGSFVLKRRFSASAFEDDILEHGVTFMNYVGQPIHYILAALEKKHGSPEAVEAALARHPQNKFRIATGNGAPPIDRKKMLRYLGMEHIYELYGSTEAPINACLKPGDPIDCLGQLTSKKVMILNERDEACCPAEVDAEGKIVNYDQAVGEITKQTEQDNIFFDGYFKNSEATGKKFRNGYFRSGDLGYVRVIDGKRFLYFVGRTDDWIRKDGENFSAESVIPYVLELPGVGLAAAYGAPCEVADEKVMVAISLEKDAAFDPKAAYDFFMDRQKKGGMDPKWMPDFIRIVDGFDMTHQTQKILVRPLKREHYNLEKFPAMKVFYRRRGDDTYLPLTPEAFTEIKQCFTEMGRLEMLYTGL